jgi:hypothetical protein
MLMLTAYFDETGSDPDPNSKFVGMAGCLAPADKWDEFSIKWQATLEAEHLPFFHMNEFSSFSGEFRTGWRTTNDQRRKDLYGKLWDIIIDTHPLFIGVFLPLSAYKEILHESHLVVLRNAYYLVYAGCLEHILQYANDPIIESEIATIFDNKKGFKDHAGRIYDYFSEKYDPQKVPPPVFRDMRKILPLQAADIVAYELYKELDRMYYGLSRPKRWGYERLENFTKTYFPEMPFVFLTKEMLQELNNRYRQRLHLED